MIADEIEELLKEEHIPVWATGPASEMANEAAGYRPADLLPGAQGLLCFGTPVPQGVYRMPAHGPESIWRSQNLYYRRLDTLSIRLAALLEEQGGRAVPVYGFMPMDVNLRGEVVGFLNLIRMGEVTGVGVVGSNGLLLHSRYGARLMLGGVVTTTALPNHRSGVSDEAGCPPDCHICGEACPVKAISTGRKRVDIMRCLAHTARTPIMSRIRFGVLTRVRPPSAARMMNQRVFDELTFHVCSRCVALCPYGGAN